MSSDLPDVPRPEADDRPPLDEDGNPVPPPGLPWDPPGATVHRRTVTNPDGTVSEEVTLTYE
ncbi:hypothetical protein [Streptomyces sp. SID13031]|uniref:hypothetical protein n=1 Tax=Streptomyces sp. SID13031 TaxID=2706046 RepID=UPI0013CAA880|nr:hypothetical protein [Streptomyces sp. SID13031]NEA32046.1 hypothetical protein [Streptomyces sp. SID13031]